jgi:hypothetical protein
MDVASLTIFSVSCFTNGSNSILYPNSFSTHNISTALLPTLQHTAFTSQFWSLLIPPTCTFVIGLIFLAVDSVGEVLEGKTGWFIRFLLCVAASATCTCTTTCVATWRLMPRTLKQRTITIALHKIVSLALLGSSIILLFKSFIGKFTRKYELRLQRIKLSQNLGVYHQNRKLLLE